MDARHVTTATDHPVTDDLLVGRVRATLVDSLDVDLQDMVELVASVTGAPVVALGFLEDGVYHYDVCAGTIPFGNPADKALCQFASGAGDLLEVPDTLVDDRTRMLPSVDGREGAVRYYLSAPIVVGDREVGRFCVFDMVPRRLEDRQRAMVAVLGDAAGKILDRRLLQHPDPASDGAGSPTPRRGDELAARAAHDLRSPLVALAASLELLHDLIEPEPGSMPAVLVAKAESAVGRLHEMIGSILALQTLDREFEPTTVDLDDLLRAVREDLDGELSATGGRLEGEGLGHLHADRGQVFSLLLNLVGNALKFSRPGVPPRVLVASQPLDRGLLLTVTDEGIGVPAGSREEVFDLFTKLSSGGGHGIGLSTVSRIVEVHGGRIRLVDRPDGRGTQVRVWLPQG